MAKVKLGGSPKFDSIAGIHPYIPVLRRSQSFVFILQILEYYSKEGILDVTPLTLPGQQPNLPFLQVQNNQLYSLRHFLFLRLCS